MEKFQDVFKLLISHKAVFIFVNWANSLHYLDQVEVFGHDIYKNINVFEWCERLRVLLNHSVISAKIPSRIFFTEVSEIIQAILDALIYVGHGLMVLKLENWL